MMSRNSVPSRDITLHFLDNEAVLFDRRRQKLYSANTSAAVIWSCLQENMRPASVAALLVERFRVNPRTAERYVDEAIRQWQVWSLFDDDASGSETDPFDRIDEIFPPAADALTDPAVVRRYRLLDSVFRVRFASRFLCRRVDPILSHLAIDGSVSDGPVFDLLGVGHSYALLEEGRTVLRCDGASQVAAMTKTALVYRALRESRDLCAIHAGAVRRGGACLLLPGESGAGKSTLVAGLVSEGFELLGDDTAVLTREKLLARPIPCGICVKESAWPSLAVRFPRLETAEIHDRPDGQTVRYLLPPEFTFADPGVRAPVGWVVFPRFDAKAATALYPIDKNAALRRLIPCFVPLREGLEAADVERLVRWIAGVPCYQLTLSSLNEAVALLGHLCR